jgi:hypothetical protein
MDDYRVRSCIADASPTTCSLEPIQPRFVDLFVYGTSLDKGSCGAADWTTIVGYNGVTIFLTLHSFTA